MNNFKLEHLSYSPGRKLKIAICLAISALCVVAAVGLLAAVLISGEPFGLDFTGVLLTYVIILALCLIFGLWALRLVRKTREDLAAAVNAASVPVPVEPKAEATKEASANAEEDK